MSPSTLFKRSFVKPSAFVAAVFLVVAGARGAAAQIFVNPFVDSTLSAPSTSGSRSQPGFGIAIGNVGTVVGFETEFAYHPELFDNAANALAKSHVLTLAQNILVGPTIGRVKPYGAAGAGDLYLNVTRLSSVVIPSPESISTNYFTVNVGGGLMGFVTAHLGVRADLRYYRAYGFKLTDLQTAGLALDRFDFWRAGVGVVAKF
jgi:opacity protein-like surface antigen